MESNKGSSSLRSGWAMGERLVRVGLGGGSGRDGDVK